METGANGLVGVLVIKNVEAELNPDPGNVTHWDLLEENTVMAMKRNQGIAIPNHVIQVK